MLPRLCFLPLPEQGLHLRCAHLLLWLTRTTPVLGPAGSLLDLLPNGQEFPCFQPPPSVKGSTGRGCWNLLLCVSPRPSNVSHIFRPPYRIGSERAWFSHSSPTVLSVSPFCHAPSRWPASAAHHRFVSTERVCGSPSPFSLDIHATLACTPPPPPPPLS